MSDEITELEELEAREAELSDRERVLDGYEEELVAEWMGLEGRCRVIQRQLLELLAEGHMDAGRLLDTLPHIAPPPPVHERARALAARRAALAAREEAAQTRRRAADWLFRTLGEAMEDLAACDAASQALAIAPADLQMPAVSAGGRPGGDVFDTVETPALVSPPSALPPRVPAALASPIPHSPAPAQPARDDSAPAPEVAVRAPVAQAPAAAEAPPPESARAETPRADVPRVVAPRAEALAPELTPESSRRIARRARLDCKVSLDSPDNFFAGFARNISEGGLFVATFDLRPLGSEVDVHFALPGGTSINARAVVRWVRTLEAEAEGVTPGMGVEFIDLDPASRRAIDNFMGLREPMFFVD